MKNNKTYQSDFCSKILNFSVIHRGKGHETTYFLIEKLYHLQMIDSRFISHVTTVRYAYIA
jgi:hypothetical protein